jgi:hypothetical protein
MPTRCLIVSGVLLDEQTLNLGPGFITDDEPTPGPAGGEGSPDAVILELIRSEGRVERAVLDTTPLCLTDAGPPGSRLVHGLVAYDEPAERLRFLFDDHVVHEAPVEPAGPQIRLEWQPRPSMDGSHEINWTARQPTGAPLWFLPLYRFGDNQQRPLGLPQRESSLTIDFDDLPGGEACVVRIVASDGVNTAVVDSDPFFVARKGRRPLILAPDDGATLSAGDPLTLAGQILDLEVGGESTSDLRWASSRDGELGTGATIDVILSGGTHAITAEIDGGTEDAFITVTVVPNPCSPTGK